MDDIQLQRFMDKVHMEPNTGCWLWVGAVNAKGHSVVSHRAVLKMGHRASYEHFVGPIDPGLQIDHLCRQRCCVNPEHLEPVTSRENTMRGYGPAAMNSRKTNCANGHAYTQENTLLKKDSVGRVGRQCRICGREYQRRWRSMAARRASVGA
jgi:hypothetical protein